ncbi:MAG: hypothetical protein ACXADX_18310, partial [Candidatus Hodarchaeales archaeon]
MKRAGWKNRLFVLTTLVLLMISPSFGMTGGNESTIPPQVQQGNNRQMGFANKLQPASITTEQINEQQSPAPLVIESTRAMESEAMTSYGSDFPISTKIGTHEVKVRYLYVYIEYDHDDNDWGLGPGEWIFSLKVDLDNDLGYKSWNYEPNPPAWLEVSSKNWHYFDPPVGQTRDLKGGTTFKFSVRAIEYDIGYKRDYESRVDVTPTVSSFNEWVEEEQWKGDVLHGYKYIMHNDDPKALDPIGFSGGWFDGETFTFYEGFPVTFYLEKPPFTPFDPNPSYKTHDPDGDGIIAIEWDQDYTPGAFSVDSTSLTPTFTYNTPGEYTIAYRVKDALG